MGKQPATEVARKEKAGLPAQYDYSADVGIGYENQTGEELQIPFLAVLQTGSPQVTGEKGVKDARPGLLYNTVTEEILGQSVLFVPATREHVFVEWTPRTKGGGFKGRYKRDDALVVKAIADAKEFGKYHTPAGNDLVETFYLYGTIVRESGEIQPVVIAFSSTKIKVYKQYNTKMNMFTVEGPDGRKQKPPRFAHLMTVGVRPEKNAKGNFFNFTLQPARNNAIKDSLLTPDDPRYQAARALGEMVSAGKARAAEETQRAAADETEEGRPGVF